jgi:hypothetical protein
MPCRVYFRGEVQGVVDNTNGFFSALSSSSAIWRRERLPSVSGRNLILEHYVNFQPILTTLNAGHRKLLRAFVTLAVQKTKKMEVTMDDVEIQAQDTTGN